jgi:hypothetical protein
MKQPSLLILPAGAIPMELTQGHSNPEVERSLYNPPEQSAMIEQLTETIILLQKNLRRVTRERDTYKMYVPRELLTMGCLQAVTLEPLPINDAGQITDDS